jgi:hypothetical protein
MLALMSGDSVADAWRFLAAVAGTGVPGYS